MFQTALGYGATACHHLNLGNSRGTVDYPTEFAFMVYPPEARDSSNEQEGCGVSPEFAES
jgi:hypothetical protein